MGGLNLIVAFQMCIEGEEFKDCKNWPLMGLEEIMTRHEFLQKTGKYLTPDPKHPQKKMENPRLHQILDSNDDHFATQVAGVTIEEWTIYRAFAKKISERSDKERPYERVKPSLRKAYERRRKEAKIVEDHVFDVSAPRSR
ncbi:unnamed protein product [Strongylus vulgaris]|uniref:Uncharacterized protein n=1 Tax=Strongylus vulgaris TaxID=40348 RepID=A0A3P7JIL5_STRVU|nr:unnamed protein product [Strongylus vulgaris]